MADIKPTYEHEVVPPGLVTLAPYSSDEYTYYLKRHVGKEGRKKDIEILRFIAGLRKSDSDEVTYFIDNEDEFTRIAIICLDLDEHEGVFERMTLFDLIAGFQQSIGFRTGSIQRPDVQKALKK